MRRGRRIILVIVLIVALGAAVYPIISDYFVSKLNAEIVLEEKKNQADTKKESLVEAKAAAIRYNERLVLGESDVDEYNSLLNISGNGIMGVVEIPVISVTLPIYHGCDDEVLEHGIGHVYGSSLPVGVASSHACLSGHSAMRSQKMFTDLERLEHGDLFHLYVLDEKLTYKVDQIKTVLPEEVEAVSIEQGKDYVTLITCTPYGINTHRLLVRGERITETQTSELPQTATPKKSLWHEKYIEAILLGVGTAVVVLVFYFSLRKILNRRKNNEKYSNERP